MLTSLLLAMALAADPAADPEVSNCVIYSINDQFVPGADPGVLSNLKVQEGMLVTKDMELGAIDDNEARAMLQVKKLELEVAIQKGKSDVNIRHAEAARDVAQATVNISKEANKLPGTVSKAEMLKLELEVTKTALAIEQAKEQQIEDRLTANAKKAEVDAAQVALERRVLRAPFDGVVTLVNKKPGEWVAAGDPVVQIVGINRLRVMGNLDAAQWGPDDIAGRAVTVTVMLPRGRTIDVPGKVTYVSPVVKLGNLPVWAEIETPMENNLPVIQAGLKATMKIHVNQPVARTSPQASPYSARTAAARN
jgi:multidrug resistance efflux pump